MVHLDKVSFYLEKSEAYDESFMAALLLALVNGSKCSTNDVPDLANQTFLHSIVTYASKQNVLQANKKLCHEILTNTLDTWNFILASPSTGRNHSLNSPHVIRVYKSLTRIERSMNKRVHLTRTLNLIKLFGPLNILVHPLCIASYPFQFLSSTFFEDCRSYSRILENSIALSALITTYKKNLASLEHSHVSRSVLTLLQSVVSRFLFFESQLRSQGLASIQTFVLEPIDSFRFLRQTSIISPDYLEQRMTINVLLNDKVPFKSPPRRVWLLILDQFSERPVHVNPIQSILEASLTIHQLCQIFTEDSTIQHFVQQTSQPKLLKNSLHSFFCLPE
ncbi:hypothetical protein Ciccas_008619 [Cichlidogyrus casuarinus]|uniref:Maturase K n=1 Tax=Cichlidogyrus casuarinus TaxID=1844966 RepID=A0ABD2PZE6_9PLAT